MQSAGLGFLFGAVLAIFWAEDARGKGGVMSDRARQWTMIVNYSACSFFLACSFLWAAALIMNNADVVGR